MKTRKHKNYPLTDYVLGELSNSKRKIVEKHVATCSECQGEIVEMRSLIDNAPAPLHEEPPHQLSAAVIESAHSALRQARRKTGLSFVRAVARRPLAYAAALIVLAGLFAILLIPARHDTAQSPPGVPTSPYVETHHALVSVGTVEDYMRQTYDIFRLIVEGEDYDYLLPGEEENVRARLEAQIGRAMVFKDSYHEHTALLNDIRDVYSILKSSAGDSDDTSIERARMMITQKQLIKRIETSQLLP